ncbi:hypothetical protein QBC32DRAFT_203732 [Pseudoneurospora amorphoporcata]|uniref:Uncharacterized protein n=1 Tax=Pseudoneurospora amorphoporcata TaxID=241081 RepID=A0AAN6SJ08_9PEZI|nr:hypothetical protein QBC32DRAFT_203732 [Pseudoneurospora amorphoporcata]
MFDPNYSMEDQGQQPVAAAPPASNDDYMAPDTDGFDLDGFPESPHLKIQEQLLRSQQQQRNYVRRHHVARRRQRHPSHHKIQKRPSLTTNPSASSSMTTAARTTSATSTASAPASTSASSSATAPASASASVPSFRPSSRPIELSGKTLSPSAQHVFDKLTHEYRVHNLQQEALPLEAQSLVQQQQQQQQRKEPEQQQQQVPLSPPTAMSLVPDTAAATTGDHQSWAGLGSLEVDDGIEMDDAFDLEDAKLQSLLPPSFRHIDYPSSVAPSIPNAASSSSANTSESKGKRPERRQLKHNAQTQSRSIQALVEEMVETGTQCNVRSAPLPAPSAPVLSTLDDLKVDHGYDFASMELEVDERYRDGTVDVLEEERALLESIQVRRAGAGNGPAGVRKHTVEGTLPLRYQLSAEAAMRCATVVRSRPRMRRRKEHGTGSVTSSVAYSTNSSPMAQPVQPSEQLQSQYLPAIPSSSYHTPP